jgi:hypothetical protein
MAKQYYNLSEAAAALKMSEDQVRSLVRDGQLREYRDAGKVHYRVEDVERLAAKEGSSIIDLAMESSGEVTLADSKDLTALGRGADTDVSGSGAPTADMLADSGADIALAGSSILDFKEEAAKAKEDTRVTGMGVSVFDDDDLQLDVDPMAETRITQATTGDVGIGGGGGGVGSGSGLLDLTRESDDTSLGAELLDVISPTDSGSGETETQPDTEAAETVAMPEEAVMEAPADYGAPAVAAAPMMVTTVAYPVDPAGPIFTGLLAACVIMLSLVGLTAASALQGVWPGFLAFMAAGMNLYIYVVGGGVLVALIGAGIGWFMSRSGPGGAPAPRPKRAPKQSKAAKAA